MAFYPPPGSQHHSIYSPLPPVTAYPASSSRRSRRHSSSSSTSYPPVLPASNANYGRNSYPYMYGQGYSGAPTITSSPHNGQVYTMPRQPPTITSTPHNGQVYTLPQQPRPVHQTQPPFFGNPYIPPGSNVPGGIMGPSATHYGYQGNQNYYPMQGSQFGQPQPTIIVKMDERGRRRRRHHHRRRSSSY